MNLKIDLDHIPGNKYVKTLSPIKVKDVKELARFEFVPESKTYQCLEASKRN